MLTRIIFIALNVKRNPKNEDLFETIHQKVNLSLDPGIFRTFQRYIGYHPILVKIEFNNCLLPESYTALINARARFFLHG
jgi:hypothetical protein